MKPNKNIQNFPIFIDGKFHENNTDIFPSLNPHNEEIWATFSVAGKSEVDLAIAAARPVSYTHLTLPTKRIV